MTQDELDDKIKEWHESDSDSQLPDYLGFTWAEYAHWVNTGYIPERP